MERFVLDEMMQFGEQFTLTRLEDGPEAQINLVTLPPKQALPAHNSNANVRLLVLKGRLTLTVSGGTAPLDTHEMAVIPFDTPMRIANDGESHAAFVVIKTPNPDRPA